MRKVTSLILVLSGFIELITSIVLYIIPAGRVAYWADYHLLGLSKNQWGNIHIAVGALLILAGTCHVYFNWRPIIAYLKNKSKKLTIFNRHSTIAFIISLYFVIGAIYLLPPINYILDFGEHISALGNKKYGEPPYGHAELSSLRIFCKKMDIDLTKATKLLESKGIIFTNDKESIKSIAKNNDITPQELYDKINSTDNNSHKKNKPFPKEIYPGFGKNTIGDISKKYDLSKNDILIALNNSGFNVKEKDIIKDVKENNNINTIKIFEIIKDVADKRQ